MLDEVEGDRGGPIRIHIWYSIQKKRKEKENKSLLFKVIMIVSST